MSKYLLDKENFLWIFLRVKICLKFVVNNILILFSFKSLRLKLSRCIINQLTIFPIDPSFFSVHSHRLREMVSKWIGEGAGRGTRIKSIKFNLLLIRSWAGRSEWDGALPQTDREGGNIKIEPERERERPSEVGANVTLWEDKGGESRRKSFVRLSKYKHIRLQQQPHYAEKIKEKLEKKIKILMLEHSLFWSSVYKWYVGRSYLDV